MDECAGAFPGAVVPGDAALEREFTERLAESSTLVLRVAYSVVRNREDAEDIAQDACVRAYRQFSRLRDRDRFRAWLVRITWRLAIDRSRARQRRAAREQWVETREARTAEQVAQDRERTTLLWQAIDNLAPKLRIVVILAAIKGHDVGEVARLLQLPEGTVKSRLWNLQYRNVGTNIDCSATSVESGFNLSVTLSDSSIHLDRKQSGQDLPAVSGAPAFRTFTSNFSILLRDGQTAQYTSATDPVSGEVMKVDVTLNVLK